MHMSAVKEKSRVGFMTSVWQNPDAGRKKLKSERKEEGKGEGGKRERGREIHLPATEISVNLRTYPREYLQNLLLFYYLLEMPLRMMVTFLKGGLLNLIHFLRHCI